MSHTFRTRAPRSPKSPLEKAADTRRTGLIFLLSAAPMAIASLLAALASGQSAAAITTAPSMLAFVVIGAAMYVAGRRDLARLAVASPRE